MNIEKIKAKLNEAREKFDVPAYSFSLYHDDKTINFSDGFCDLEGSKQADDETIYAIASCTKSFVAGTIGTLVDQGKMKLDDPVKKFIPEFEMYDRTISDRITVRDVLSHRTGLQRHEFAWYPYMEHLTEEDIVKKVAHLKAGQQLRYKWQYNNMMFMLAAHIITKATGKPWKEVMRENILEPLEMTGAFFSYKDAAKTGKLANPYLKDPKTQKIIKLPYADFSNIGGAGTLHMTASDLGKWGTVLANEGKWNDKQILSKEMTAQMCKMQMIRDEEIPAPLQGILKNLGYGLGLATENFRGMDVIYHTGHIDGFMSYLCIMPEKKTSWVILTNLGVSNAIAAMNYMLSDELLGIESDWINDVYNMQLQEKENLKKDADDLMEKRPENSPCPVALELIEGRYSHPGYGEITLTKEDDQTILIHMGRAVLVAKHYANQFFYFEEPGLLPGMKFELSIDITAQGEVTGFEAGFDFETKEKIPFVKITE